MIPHYFSPNWGETGRETEKRIWTPIPLIVDPGEKISEKIAKKLEKIQKELSGVMFRQNEDLIG